MPKATKQHTTTSRRGFLATASAISAVGITAGTAASVADAVQQGPDAELIRLCAAHDELERQLGAALRVATIEEERAAEPIAEALKEQQTPIVLAIVERPPQTPEGWRAVAATLTLMEPALISDLPGCNDEILLTALLRGLLGRA